jgi:hypothetical protein
MEVMAALATCPETSRAAVEAAADYLKALNIELLPWSCPV